MTELLAFADLALLGRVLGATMMDQLEDVACRALEEGIDPRQRTHVPPYDREAEYELAWQEEQADRRAWGA